MRATGFYFRSSIASQAAAVICSGLVILASGCGGTPTFHDQAQASCERAYDAGRAVSKPSAFEPFGSRERIAYGRRMMPIFETMLSDMRALTPPADQSATMGRFTKALNEAVDDMREAIVVAEARDQRRAQQLGIELEADWKTAKEFAKELDLSDCEFLA